MFIDWFISVINLNCGNKQDNGCAFENHYIQVIHMYLEYILVREQIHNCKDLTEF